MAFRWEMSLQPAMTMHVDDLGSGDLAHNHTCAQPHGHGVRDGRPVSGEVRPRPSSNDVTCEIHDELGREQIRLTTVRPVRSAISGEASGFVSTEVGQGRDDRLDAGD